jgi:hypothetical protein
LKASDSENQLDITRLSSGILRDSRFFSYLFLGFGMFWSLFHIRIDDKMCRLEAIPLATAVAAALEEEKLAQVQQFLGMLSQKNGHIIRIKL